MKKYFNTLTNEEVFIGKPLNIELTDDECCIKINTSNLSAELADHLVVVGVLTNEEPVKVSGDIAYYVAKLAKKLNVSVDTCKYMLNTIQAYSPSTVFSLLAKQVALELDNKYPGHIKENAELYCIELVRGHIVPITLKKGASLRNVTLFRSSDDAAFAIQVLKELYVKMFRFN